MVLERTSTIEKVEILENGNIQVAIAVRVMDGEELESSRYLRFVLHPGEDVDEIVTEFVPNRLRPPIAQLAKLRRVANAVWS